MHNVAAVLWKSGGTIKACAKHILHLTNSISWEKARFYQQFNVLRRGRRRYCLRPINILNNSNNEPIARLEGRG